MGKLVAHEVTTVYSLNGAKTKFMGKYLVVIEGKTSKAVSLVPLREGEEILRAEELRGYTVIVENK